MVLFHALGARLLASVRPGAAVLTFLIMQMSAVCPLVPCRRSCCQDEVMRRNPRPYQRGELVVVIDCSDLGRSAEFWAQVLGYVQEGPAVGPYQGLIPADGAGAEVLLQQVPDEKRQKNRLHLDPRTPELEPEVRRVLGIGASLLTEEPLQEFGWRWQVLADPDGNEFCVVQPPDSSRMA
jgi:catechol 2,3-dioxygenase-like lactoylglutathione lyase family enzyme